jgi:carbonic anhydrase/acetyltransferase-like protein (isoleucine patch superfamily)
MTTAAVMAVRKNLGFMIRETGQAMDRLGCRVMGDFAFMEPLSRHRTVMGVYGTAPALGSNVFIAPSASVIGDVSLGDSSSVWYGAVLRGDAGSISVGEGTALQDRVLVNVGRTGPASAARPAVIGSRVTVGQGAVLHACTVLDEAVIGIGAHVLDGATVEKHGVLSAGSVLAPGATIKSGELWSGIPAVKVSNVETSMIEAALLKVEENAKLAAVHSAEHSKTLDVLVAEGETRSAQAGISDEYATQHGIRDQLDAEGQIRTSRDAVSN